MKYGIGYAYWGNTWECDIKKYKKDSKRSLLISASPCMKSVRITCSI